MGSGWRSRERWAAPKCQIRHRGELRSARIGARPWLYGIAVNLIGRHRRAEVRMLRALARMPVPESSTNGSEPIEDRLVVDAARPAIALALSKLPADHRDVLLLAAWAELSYEEIASALGFQSGRCAHD